MDATRDVDLTVDGAATRNAKLTGGKSLSTHYKVEAFDKNGMLKWVDEFDNLVVTAGLNDSLDKHFKGSNYTAAWYVGLTDGTPTFDAGDTMAGAHAGWTEVTAYDEAVRQTLTLGAVVELTEAEAEHLSHDSPGVVRLLDEKEPEARNIAAPPQDRMVRKTIRRAGGPND